ncbi:unnamed protein product [Rodentolepis nana]|uniref:Inner membrane protein n=1 Tax=Rodentolepis nana TaxID=102285 RepID=A0A0R3T640_RODNA|nr:unnamed protein product [Rodentolepis nana]
MYIGLVTQCVSIILIWVGLCTSRWACGDLVRGCKSREYKNIHYILFAGAGCVSLAFLLDIFRCFCVKKVLEIIRLIVQFAGGVLMLSGLIMYYSLQSNQLSGFLTTMGSTAFIFVSVFGIADLVLLERIG